MVGRGEKEKEQRKSWKISLQSRRQRCGDHNGWYRFYDTFVYKLIQKASTTFVSPQGGNINKWFLLSCGLMDSYSKISFYHCVIWEKEEHSFSITYRNRLSDFFHLAFEKEAHLRWCNAAVITFSLKKTTHSDYKGQDYRSLHRSYVKDTLMAKRHKSTLAVAKKPNEL